MASLSPKSERRSSVLLGRRTSASHRRGAASIAAPSNQGGTLQSLIRQAAASHLDDDSTVQDSKALIAQTLADLDNPASSASAFLASLTTQTLKSLESQPQFLASTSKTLDDQLSALCQRHVGPLSHVHQSNSALPAAVESVQGDIRGLVDTNLPQLAIVARNFPSLTREPLAARERANELLEAHASNLPDLLDIPDLITTCIRNGNHREAIELAAYIAKLARPDSPLGGGPILQSLRARSWVSLQELRDQLLEGLQSRNLALSAARRCMTSLRGLKELDEAPGVGHASSSKPTPQHQQLALTEPQLCLAFLRARATLLRSLLSAPHSFSKSISTSHNPATAHLSAYIDVWRQGVSDTCAMAQSLFPDLNEMPQLLSPFLRRHTRMLEGEVGRAVYKLVGQVREGASSGTSTREVTRLTDDLVSSLMALHSQLSYAAAALARLGGDVAPLLALTAGKALQEAALEIVRVPAQRASRNFVECIPSAPGQAPSSWLTQIRDVGKLSASDALSMETVPYFASLARLFNDVLIGLNCLRSFAPVEIRRDAMQALDHALLETITQLGHYCARLPEQLWEEKDSNRLVLPTLTRSEQDAENDEEDRQEVDFVASSAHRHTQAERLLAASALELLLDFVAPALRSALWRDVFGCSESSLPLLGAQDKRQEEHITSARQWASEAHSAWDEGEEARRVELQEHRRRRIEEKAEREKAAAQRRAQEAEAAAAAAAEEQRRKEAEEEAERTRKQAAAEEEERRRKAAAAEAEAEEARRRAEAEAAAKRKRDDEEAKRKEEQERARMARAEAEAAAAAAAAEAKRKAEEEAARAKAAAEKEAQTKKDREEEESRAKAAAEAKVKEEQEINAKAQVEQEARAREQEARKRVEADAKAEGETDTKAQSAANSAPHTAPESSASTVHLTAATPSPSTAAQELPANPTAATGPPKKLTLAEKLKAKREERERQAVAAAAANPAAPAPSGATKEEDTSAATTAEPSVPSVDEVASAPIASTAESGTQDEPAESQDSKPSIPAAVVEEAKDAAEASSLDDHESAIQAAPPSSSTMANVDGSNSVSAEASARNSGEESEGEAADASGGGVGNGETAQGDDAKSVSQKKKKKKKGKKK
ncbi:hypothetical protein BDZ90DRAFT_6433 [Jaminaea rosea]|uniref:Conserved oligomeric Golgi complex subunit 8 n=1 Tax=Jaminaea rosea TaxID=1569628 RepID=A0A316UZI8_9BASI|nr:hypothetical protein BDZ90DRAFT_6433 [Jaminaea rosea]PWN30178.1 hypothetical protein BDZ90DRAFT_6433 [Jaminaea rosea]